jgi:hypothetical protein
MLALHGGNSIHPHLRVHFEIFSSSHPIITEAEHLERAVSLALASSNTTRLRKPSSEVRKTTSPCEFYTHCFPVSAKFPFPADSFRLTAPWDLGVRVSGGELAIILSIPKPEYAFRTQNYRHRPTSEPPCWTPLAQHRKFGNAPFLGPHTPVRSP